MKLSWTKWSPESIIYVHVWAGLRVTCFWVVKITPNDKIERKTSRTEEEEKKMDLSRFWKCRVNIKPIKLIHSQSVRFSPVLAFGINIVNIKQYILLSRIGFRFTLILSARFFLSNSMLIALPISSTQGRYDPMKWKKRRKRWKTNARKSIAQNQWAVFMAHASIINFGFLWLQTSIERDKRWKFQEDETLALDVSQVYLDSSLMNV